MAQRIVFSFLNGLPFYLSEELNSEITKYDRLTDIDKVKAFINEIGNKIASIDIASNYSYPIAVSDIKSGDIFIYREASGNHHAYLIKDILENGNLILWYSSTPRLIRTAIKRVGMPARPITIEPYGFKRLKTPIELQDIRVKIPKKSDEQYEIVDELGPELAMVEIKKRIRMRAETLIEAIDRRIENSCELVLSRADTVNYAYELYTQNNRDFTDEEYETYSTHSKDEILYESIIQLVKIWLKAVEKKATNKIPTKTFNALNYLSGKNTTERAHKALQAICNNNIPIDFRDYIMRYKNGNISANPNDPISRRWGENEE